MSRITGETVRGDFNDPAAVVHYARAAHFLGLWASERILIERFFPDRKARLLEAGCGAGRATVGMWDMGYHNLTAFDFAAEQLDQAKSLARERAAEGIRFALADATRLDESELGKEAGAYDGVLFLFNGLMQIPGRENRRAALRQLRLPCRSSAPLLFTTHDRDAGRAEQALWRLEAARWERGEQDPRLVEFGDRYFSDENGSTFMHLPVRAEILEDLAATGWGHEYDELRRQVSPEPESVRDFSDECRFWAARAP